MLSLNSESDAQRRSGTDSAPSPLVLRAGFVPVWTRSHGTQIGARSTSVHDPLRCEHLICAGRGALG